ncbi:MAG: conserved membrane protein of unknown function [Promethearchaeota archaeon]|nr:MAG: conserved membrane protein of unknown function [Candidatus Lokiarchaeota archaeon]
MINNVLLTIGLNVLPLVLFAFPLLFIRKRLIGKLYLRIFIGIVVFFLIYWVAPVMFQFNLQPNRLDTQQGQENLGISYIFTHFSMLISAFLSYPFIILPFIFFFTPFISMIIVWNNLKKSEGSLDENLKQISYEYNTRPLQLIKQDLLKQNWDREKEILKLMIVLLPVSLYILQVILKVSGLQNFSLTTAETALGWFLEILFVYLAIFIFSIELINSSKIAIKGRYFGEQVRDDYFRSLYMVGLPISAISIFLFILEYFDSIDVIFAFFAYFIMASIVFVLFLGIFEPISILILVKLIDWWKKRKEESKSLSYRLSPLYNGLFFGALVVGIYWGLSIIFGYTLFANSNYINRILELGLFNAYPNPLTNPEPTLNDALGFDILFILFFIVNTLLPIILIVVFLYYAFKYGKNIPLTLAGFLGVVILASFLLPLIPYFGSNPLINILSTDEYWFTGRASLIPLNGIEFATLRTATFRADLTGVLGVLAIPYVVTRNIFNVIFWGIFIYYLGRQIKIKNIPLDEKRVKRVIFTDTGSFATYTEFKSGEPEYLVDVNENVAEKEVESSLIEIQNIMNVIDKDEIYLAKLKKEISQDSQTLYENLKYLYNKKQIELWKPELTFTFERVKKLGLYVIYEDGRSPYDYKFSEESAPDPGLISGMFSAITSFIKETTKSTEFLQTIEHGDITILIEYGKNLFGALFIKGNQTSEIRNQLREFVAQFENKYKDTLEDWGGELKPFKDANQLVEHIFTTTF